MQRWLALSLALVSVLIVHARAEAQVDPIEPMPPELRVAPSAGRRTAGPGNGSFCTGNPPPLARNDVRVTRLRDVLGLRRVAEGQGRFDLENVAHLQTVARMTCAHRGDPNAAAWLAAYRQILVNGADLDDAAIDALLRASLAQTGRTWEFPCDGAGRAGPRREGAPAAAAGILPPLPLQATPDVRMRRRLLEGLVCDPNRLVILPELLYWIDRPGGPGWPDAERPHVTRAAIVRITARAWDHDAIDAAADVQLGSRFTEWLAAADDAALIDVGEARRELASSGLAPDMQAIALARIARTRVAALAIGEAWRAAARATPGMEPFVGEIPRQARAEWEAETRDHAAAIADAYAVESAWLAHDDARLRGCDARMRAHLVTYAASRHPRSEADVRALFDRPVGYLIGAALVRCDVAAGHPGRARVLQEILERLLPQRGPRMAVLHAARRAVAEVQERAPGFALRVEPMDPSRTLSREEDWIAADRASSAIAGQGVVGTLQRDGDEVRVTFRHATAQVPVYSCTPTGRIARIDREGRVEYERNCVVVGQETVDATPEPVTLPADLMHGVVAGAWLHMQRGDAQNLHGYPLEVRARPGDDPSSYLGLALR